MRHTRLVLAAVLALVPAHARAECMAYGLAAKVATPNATTLPVDGGIVVYAEPLAGANLDPGDPTLVPDWKWRGGGKPVVVNLAPGLSVIRAPRTPGKGELVDGKGAAKVAIRTSSELRDTLAAPKPRAVRHSTRQGRRGGEDVEVELDAAPPNSALAIVLLDDKSKPKSWRLLGETTLTTVAAYSQGGCVALPNGTRPTKPGDLVRVAFVDDVGRMSAVSAPIKVAAKPSP